MSQTLDKGYIEKKEKGSGEYQDLYLEGIELLQNLSGAHWTDYNEHDSGVTIFENLAYTLTNLSYKVDMPIIDILTESKKRDLVSGDNGFFIASEILTTNPIIKEDYRKVLVDGIKNVKNVWINTLNQGREAVELGKLNLQGLYHVFIEMYEYDTTKAELEKEENRVKSEARKLFHAQRNLCEDLYDVTVLRPLQLSMVLHLTLDMEADGEAVFGQVYYDINDFLTHEAKFESLWELKQQEVEFNSIHTGPTLDNGFIRDKELRELKRSIYLSDLTKIISKVPGVVSIDKFEITGAEITGDEITKDENIKEEVIKEELTKDEKTKDEKTEEKKDDSSEGDQNFGKEILVPVDRTPRFDLPDQDKATKSLVFKTADISLVPNAREIKKRYVGIEAEHYGNFKTVSEALNKAEIPPGEALGIPSYYSVREQFPAIYGIGHFGLPRGSSKKRIAQAKQLKAYLLPFDQLMANFLAQLNNVYTLYNANDTKLETYFYQVLEDMREMADTRDLKDSRTTQENERIQEIADEGVQALVKVDHSNPVHIQGQWRKTLKDLNVNTDTRAIERLNEVTDTMLARFAEDFPTYVLQKINTSCFGKHFTDEEFDKKLLGWKRKLISNYGYLSYNRSKSFDYLEDGPKNKVSSKANTQPVIIEKIAILLGIRHPELRNISKIMDHTQFDAELMMDAPPEDFEKSDLQVFRRLYRTMRDLSLGGKKDEANLNTLFKLGVVESNFLVIDKSESKDFSELKLNDANTLSLLRDRSISKIGRAKRNAVNLMKKLNEKTEGIHLLEHILLAPRATGKHFGYSFAVITKVCSDGTDERILFKHVSRKSSDERNKDIDIIRNTGNSNTKLIYKKSSSRSRDSFRIEIYKDKDELLAKSETTYPSNEKADKAIQALIDLQKQQKDYPITDINYLAYLNDSEVTESFFSFRMSFLLPAWPVRFQQDSFRIQFNNILYQQVPIHIHYNTHWLGLSEMSKFETAYFKWLDLLQNAKEEEERMQAALALVEIIEEFQNSGKVA